MTDANTGGRELAPLDQQPANKPLFKLGQLVATTGALDTLERFGVTPHSLIHRHVQGDWGDLSAHDCTENWLSVEQGFRVFSAYTMTRNDGTLSEIGKLWCITEADRSCTTLLRPDEY